MLGQIASSITTLIALVLAIRLFWRFRERRRLHTLAYALSLALFTLASAADASGRMLDTVPEALYRLYWFSAAGLVGLMAVGTGFLIVPHMGRGLLGRFGRWLTIGAVGLTALLMAWLLVEVLRMTVTPQQLAVSRETFLKAPGTFAPLDGPKLPFVLTSSLGALVIFLGAGWSYWRTRAGYTLVIALAALVFSLGGSALNLGGDLLFYASQLLGTVLLYLGVNGSIQPQAVLPASGGHQA